MSKRGFIVPVIALPLMMVVTTAMAQKFDLHSPPPERPQDHRKTPPENEPSRPRMPEADLYPHRPPVRHAPGFIPPLVKETETGRFGLAGWTSPNTPVGSRLSADPDNAGWPGLGLGMEWGGPPKSAVR